MPMSMMGIALPWVGGAMILAELETDSLRISSASRHRGLWREGMKGEEEECAHKGRLQCKSGPND